jgi:uncharacterized protein YyaL (SSP411 family)
VFVSIEQLAQGTAARARRGRARSRRRARQTTGDPRKRVWPGLDDKILTSWNALAIRGWPSRRASLDKPDSPRRGRRARFVRATCGGGPAAGHVEGRRAHLNAYLDDYAYLADALLEMLQLRWRNEDVAWLREILDAMLEHFQDAKLGGFFLHVRRSRDP